MEYVIKRFFVNADGGKQFADVVTGVLDPSVLDDLSEAICKRNPTDLGVYCMDMSSQTILHKWSWNATAEPPAPFKSW